MIFYTIFIGQTEINKTISLLKKCFIYKVLDITLAKNAYGWTTDIQCDSLKNNLTKTIDWYKNNKI